jgi:hypothetical protein
MGLFGNVVKSVKQLVEEGYPESVAKKIFDGDLPMDEASRVARREEQMTPDQLYRGHSANTPPRSDEDMFLSNSPRTAQTYADNRGDVWDEASGDYVKRKGAVTPLRTNADNLFEVDVYGNEYTYPHVNVPGYGMAMGSDEIANAVKLGNHRAGGQGLQGTKFNDMMDDYNGYGEPSDVYNILGSYDGVKIRHADKAAFDPDYNGPNIMGGAAGTAGVAGLLAAGQSNEADAGPALALAKGIDLDRLVSAWQKKVSREPDIAPETHLQNIMHDKGFVNYNDWATFARKQDGGKNGETYFNGLKPMLMDISKHAKVGKDKRLMTGLTKYAKTRFADRKAQGFQKGAADPMSLLPVAGIGAAAASLAAPHIKDSGMISAPRSDGLAEFTQGARNLQRDLKGSPMSLLFPDGIVNYLETTNRRTEDPNATTRLGALMDFL